MTLCDPESINLTVDIADPVRRVSILRIALASSVCGGEDVVEMIVASGSDDVDASMAA